MNRTGVGSWADFKKSFVLTAKVSIHHRNELRGITSSKLKCSRADNSLARRKEIPCNGKISTPLLPRVTQNLWAQKSCQELTQSTEFSHLKSNTTKLNLPYIFSVRLHA